MILVTDIKKRVKVKLVPIVEGSINETGDLLTDMAFRIKSDFEITDRTRILEIDEEIEEIHEKVKKLIYAFSEKIELDLIDIGRS